MMVSTYKRIFKIIIAGNGGIGKTTFLKLFCNGVYDPDQGLTIGMEIFVKLVEIQCNRISLQIWDFGGQDQFRFMLNTYVSGAAGVILGFDMNQRKSFLDLDKWIKLLRRINHNLPIVLVATKKDLGYHPALDLIDIKNFVRKNDLIDFIEISSKNNYNVEKPFKILLENVEHTNEQDIKFLDFHKNKLSKK